MWIYLFILSNKVSSFSIIYLSFWIYLIFFHNFRIFVCVVFLQNNIVTDNYNSQLMLNILLWQSMRECQQSAEAIEDADWGCSKDEFNQAGT
jgi:low affinity Fe/Cu permease